MRISPILSASDSNLQTTNGILQLVLDVWPEKLLRTISQRLYQSDILDCAISAHDFQQMAAKTE